MSNVFDGLKPKLVWEHFYNINQIPRCSKNEEGARAYVKGVAEWLNLEYKEDAVGNIVIKKAASAGMENSPTVILQGHVDMVCEKNVGTIHDFTKDPIKMMIDDGWVKADGTTATAETGWYFPLFWGTVGFLHAEGGYIWENSDKLLPDYDRFYLGGINSVRGFDWREIGPTKNIDNIDIDIGGTQFIQFNVEYLFPIIKESGLVGLFFYDAGNAWADDGEKILGCNNLGLRDSFGFGIRWFSPMGPLRLERGYIIDPEPGEGSGRWEFSMGGSF